MTQITPLRINNSTPRAIPLITFNSQSDSYESNQEAIDLICSVETEVVFISIAGRQRSGKSLLLNKLLWKLGAAPFISTYFTVGDTINPCTEGLWVFNQPIVHGHKTIFLIDSEGKDSLTKDKKHDAKLMSVISIMSSFLVLNVKGILDLEEF